MPTDYSQNNRGFNHFGGQLERVAAGISIRDRVLIEHMGGPFAERENNFAGMRRVLDLPCRTGIWTARVAQLHPEIEVIGLEHLPQMIEYAQGVAEAQRLGNVHFELLKEPITTLPFPNDFFDLINASFLMMLLHVNEWPAFLQECLRITRPGGSLRIMEAECGITNSLPVEQLSSLFLQGLHLMGKSAAPDGRHIGLMPLLNRLFRHAGWHDIKRRAFAEDYMCGPGVPFDPAARVEFMANTMNSIILQQQLATSDEVEQLLQEAIKDLEQEDFCGLIFLLTIYAHKPLAG